jgi:hypothetical protein
LPGLRWAGFALGGTVKQTDTEAKPLFASKTIRVGTFYITLGGLVGILQVFDVLESILGMVNLEDLPPDKAAWAGLILAIIGGVQVYLRTITTQPVGDGAASEQDESEIE